MNDQEIRERLEAWMPGDDTTGDPDLATALAAAQAAPHLRSWLERKVQLDTRLVAVAAAAPAPGMGQNELVARMTAAHRRKQVSSILAWAAGLAMLLAAGAAGWWQWGNPSVLRGENVAAFSEETLRYSRRVPRLDFRHPEISEVRRWLTEAGAALPANLPDWITLLPAKGCRVLSFQEQPVALICFSGQRTYHLYLAPRPIPGAEQLAPFPAVQDIDGWSVARWADERFVYSLNVKGPLDLTQVLALLLPGATVVDEAEQG